MEHQKLWIRLRRIKHKVANDHDKLRVMGEEVMTKKMEQDRNIMFMQKTNCAQEHEPMYEHIMSLKMGRSNV
jgi:hypothetical protein